MGQLDLKYKERYEKALVPIAEELEKELVEILSGVKNIDRIYARAKTVKRFLKKAEKLEKGNKKYTHPWSQIQDQVAARVVAFYLDDIPSLKDILMKEYRHAENQIIVPESKSKFGYEGEHFIMLIPNAVKPEGVSTDLIPEFFELQIKTLFQHAWAEASHELGYKPPKPLTDDQERRIAFTAAQAWGADRIFNELQRELVFEKE
jgi:putative GTP pyrophosphokinase